VNAQLINLLEALEALDLTFNEDDLAGLLARLAERQDIIMQLQKVDASLLSEHVRVNLLERIQRVLDRDRATLTALGEAFETTRQGLEKLGASRIASLGYARAHGSVRKPDFDRP